MTTRETIQGYFGALKHRTGWEELLSEGLTFTSYTSPVRELVGLQTFLEATRRFYSSIVSVQVRELITEGDKACALTRYELRMPAGSAFSSDVAELFRVKDGKIASFSIYFDSAPYPK
jgi:ketosteroid isomerase-like protein